MTAKTRPNDSLGGEVITKENCGEKLLLIQKACGMTMQDLAKALGVNKSTLAHVMHEDAKKRRPAPISLMNALDAVRLIRPADDETAASVADNKLTAAAVMRGLSALAKVSFLGRKAIVCAVGAAVGGPMGALIGAGIVGFFPTFGIIAAIKKISEMNNLKCQDAGDVLEIEKSSDDELKQRR